MKTTRRTAVILGVWTLCTVGYVWAYFARSATNDSNWRPTVVMTTPAEDGSQIASLIATPTAAPAPLMLRQRMYRTEWERWLFTPAATIESLVTGRDVQVVDISLLFRC